MYKLLLHCFCIHIQRGPSFQIAVYICVCVLALDVMHVLLLRVFKKHNRVHFLFHVIVFKRKMIMSLKSKSPVFCTIRLKYKES